MALTLPQNLPDVLRTMDGEPIRDAAQWEANRPALFAAFEEHVYGKSPGLPEGLTFEVTHHDSKAFGGLATFKQVDIRCEQGGRVFTFPLVLFLPNQRTDPAPMVLTGAMPLLLKIEISRDLGRELEGERFARALPVERAVRRGYAVGMIRSIDLAPDDPARWREGVVNLFAGDQPLAADGWGAIAAWGWGGSRVLDYAQQDDQLDARRVALLGHSRGGKAALWAGARDPRFSLIISNGSGCTGASLARRTRGESLEDINTRFPHWFNQNYKRYNNQPNALPVDQHQLMALIAPRSLYVASAVEDHWADPPGEFLSLACASPAYELYGDSPIDPQTMPAIDQPLLTSHRGYYLAPGPHRLPPEHWEHFMDFADRQWSTPSPHEDQA